MTKLTKRSRLAGVLIAGSMLVSSCGGGGDVATDLPTIELAGDRAMLAAAVERTESVDSFRFAMLIEMNVLDEGSVRIEADGAVDGTGATSMELQFKGTGGADDLDMSAMSAMFGGETMQIVQSGSTAYMKAPGLTAMLGSDADWIAMPAESSSELTFGMEMGSPTSYFADLPDQMTVTEHGRETVAGVSATKFRLDLGDLETGDADVDALLADAGPVYVWIDDTGLLRRMELSFDVLGMSGGLVIETFDFGADVDVDVPTDALSIDPDQFGF